MASPRLRSVLVAESFWTAAPVPKRLVVTSGPGVCVDMVFVCLQVRLRVGDCVVYDLLASWRSWCSTAGSCQELLEAELFDLRTAS